MARINGIIPPQLYPVFASAVKIKSEVPYVKKFFTKNRKEVEKLYSFLQKLDRDHMFISDSANKKIDHFIELYQESRIPFYEEKYDEEYRSDDSSEDDYELSEREASGDEEDYIQKRDEARSAFDKMVLSHEHATESKRVAEKSGMSDLGNPKHVEEIEEKIEQIKQDVKRIQKERDKMTSRMPSMAKMYDSELSKRDDDLEELQRELDHELALFHGVFRYDFDVKKADEF
jgi:hypothetical protein